MFKQVIHIFLSLVLLLGSSGLVVNQHFCFNKLVSTAFFGKAKKCSSGENELQKPSSYPGDTISKRSCCDDDNKFLKVQHEQRSNTITLHFTTVREAFFPVILPLSVYINQGHSDAFHRKKPPLPNATRQAILQRFLC